MLFNNNIYIYVLKSWNSFLDWPSRRKQDTYVRAFVLLFLFVESTHGIRHGKATNTLTRKERRVYFLIYENTFFLIIYEASIYHMIVTNARAVDVYIYIKVFCHYFQIYGRPAPQSDLYSREKQSGGIKPRISAGVQRPPMITNSIVRLMETHASFNNILINVNATLT